jgi:hypothetical protein
VIGEYDHQQLQVAGHSHGYITLLVPLWEVIVLRRDDKRITEHFLAVSNETPCLRWLRSFLAGSHVNLAFTYSLSHRQFRIPSGLTAAAVRKLLQAAPRISRALLEDALSVSFSHAGQR